MAMNVTEYTQISLELLPRGLAWSRTPTSAMGKLLGAFSIMYALVDEDAVGLLNEMHPQWAVQLLPEWEALLDLPECGQTNQTLKERQDAAGTKWHWYGSLNYKAFELWAAGYGYTIEIIERHPHHCLRPCNYPLWNMDYQWLVEVFVKDESPYRYWNVLDKVNDPLRFGAESIIECLLKKYKPAHIDWLFYYESEDDYTVYKEKNPCITWTIAPLLR